VLFTILSLPPVLNSLNLLFLPAYHYRNIFPLKNDEASVTAGLIIMLPDKAVQVEQ